MGSHFKDCQKNIAKRARVLKERALKRVDQTADRSHFSERAAEKSAKNERGAEAKKKVHGRSGLLIN